MEGVKAIIIQMPYEVDIGNVIQVARAEAMKLFHKPNKIRVVDIVKWVPHGWIVVVQNGDSCISKEMK